MNETKKKKTYHLVTAALMAALMCILGPLSVPIGPIPVSLTILVISFALYLLGAKWGTVSVLVYLLLGAIGLPVFSGFAGGLQKLAGPTGGYLIGFIFLAIVAGLFMEKSDYKIVWSVIGLVLGIAIAYLFGTAWFMFQTKSALSYALSVCVLPFIPFDAIKIILATVLGKSVRAALLKSHLI